MQLPESVGLVLSVQAVCDTRRDRLSANQELIFNYNNKLTGKDNNSLISVIDYTLF